MNPEMYDVAIVGAGPAGIVAANLCGLYGLKAVAFDRADDVYDLPRAVGLWDDVQRILDNAGILEAIVPSTSIPTGAEFVDSDGKRIIGFELPADFTTDNGHPPLRNFNQPELERIARKALNAHSDVELLVSHEVLEIDQDAESVTLAVRDLANQQTKTVKARWLIGCDGATSFVRKSCGIAWNSHGYDCQWLVVDISLDDDKRPPNYATQICDPNRPTTLVPLPLGMFRWEFQLREGEAREEMERPERVWSLLAPWVSPQDAKIIRAVVYRFHATIAETFRNGRVFLAGDAAHQTPPFMGQGLSSGVRDVDNLVWKLGHVRRGLADDTLLDSYSTERHPMAVAMVKHSVNTGRLIDAYAEMARGGAEPSKELQAYAYGGDAVLPNVSCKLVQEGNSDWVGQLVPQCVIQLGDASGPFDRTVGPRWAILGASDPSLALSEEALAYWNSVGAVFVTVPKPEGTMLSLVSEYRVIIVRPDRIISATCDGDTVDATALPQVHSV